METSYPKELLLSALGTLLQSKVNISPLLAAKSRIDVITSRDKDPGDPQLILSVEIIYQKTTRPSPTV